MTIADLLLNIARVLSALFGKPSALARVKDQDVAELFQKVGACLERIAYQLEAGHEPIKECSELFYYSQRLPSIVSKAAGFWGHKKAKHLSYMLDMTVDAPSNAIANFQSRKKVVRLVISHRDRESQNSDVDEEISKIKEASGLYLAASSLVKSGYGL